MMKDILLNLLFPKTCINCSQLGNYICSSCIDKYFNFQKSQRCHVCKRLVDKGFVHLECRSKTRLDGVSVCVHYNKLVERLIAKYKYSYYHDISNFLAHFYINAMEAFVSHGIEVIVPVPLHSKKEKIRGFNQAMLISNIVGRKLSMEVVAIARRVKFTHSQVGLKRQERLTNLKEAFESIETQDRAYESVVVLDDVMTTGATLEECAKVLKKRGAKRVYGVVFSRG